VGKIVFDVIDRDPIIKDKKVSITEFNLNESIEFVNATFKYPTALVKTKNTF
jgi:hypothetical protein